MTLFFHNGTKHFFFEILSTSARYSTSGFLVYIKTRIYFIFYPIIYQNIKTEFNNLFPFRRNSSLKFYRILLTFF